MKNNLKFMNLIISVSLFAFINMSIFAAEAPCVGTEIAPEWQGVWEGKYQQAGMTVPTTITWTLSQTEAERTEETGDIGNRTISKAYTCTVNQVTRLVVEAQSPIQDEPNILVGKILHSLSAKSIVILGAPPANVEVTPDLVSAQIAKLKARKMLLVLKKQ